MGFHMLLPSGRQLPYGPIFELGFLQASSLFRRPAALALRLALMDDHRFLLAPALSRLLSSGRMANLGEDGGTSDFGDDVSLPLGRSWLM